MGILLIDKLKTKIKNANLTAAEVDRLAGVSHGTVRKIIIGEVKNPGIETVSAIARALKCRLSVFLEDAEMDLNKELMPILYKDCICFCCDYIEEKKIEVTVNFLISNVNEIYLYCLEKKDQSVDKMFAQWILKKSYANQKGSQPVKEVVGRV